MLFRSIRSLVAATILVGLAVPAVAAPALFVARDADTTVYLFGTVHYVPCDGPGLDALPVPLAAPGAEAGCASWRTDAVDAALAEADELWLETIDVPSETVMARLMVEYGMLEGGQLLTDYVSDAELLAVAEMLGGPMAQALLPQLSSMKPWLLTMLVTDALISGAGASWSEGVDFALERLANEHGIPVMGFEVAEDQMRVLARDPIELQVADLRSLALLSAHGIDPVAFMQWMFETIWAFWLEGDLELVLYLTLADEEAFFDRFGEDLASFLSLAPAEVEAIYRAFAALYEGVVDTAQRLRDDYDAYIAGRNANWMPAIRDMLARPGTFFVGVGAGHLTGDAALQTLIAAEGATVQRLQ